MVLGSRLIGLSGRDRSSGCHLRRRSPREEKWSLASLAKRTSITVKDYKTTLPVSFNGFLSSPRRGILHLELFFVHCDIETYSANTSRYQVARFSGLIRIQRRASHCTKVEVINLHCEPNISPQYHQQCLRCGKTFV